MGKLKKINFGALVTIVLLVCVVVYVLTMFVKHRELDRQSIPFLNDFFTDDADWRTIPEEYRQDSEGYIKSIEEEVKKYFCDENAYRNYIEYAVLTQYKQNSFVADESNGTCRIKTEGSNFDGEKYKLSVYVSNNIYENSFDVEIVDSDSGIKISSIEGPVNYLTMEVF